MAALPICSNESMRNSSPNPGSGRAMAPETASKVLSREVIPVPPVISAAWAPAFCAALISWTMSCGSSGTMA